MTETTRSVPSAKPAGQSAGDLVRELSEQVSRLVRDAAIVGLASVIPAVPEQAVGSVKERARR